MEHSYYFLDKELESHIDFDALFNKVVAKLREIQEYKRQNSEIPKFIAKPVVNAVDNKREHITSEKDTSRRKNKSSSENPEEYVKRSKGKSSSKSKSKRKKSKH